MIRNFDGMISVGLRVATLASRFLFVILFAKLVSASEFGTYNAAVSVITIFVFALGMEFHSFSTREIAKHDAIEQRQQVYQRHIRLFLLMMLLGMPVGLMALKLLGLSTISAAIFVFVLAAESSANEVGRYLIVLQHPVASNVLVFLRSGFWGLLMIFLLYSKVDHFAMQSAANTALLLWGISSTLATVIGLRILRIQAFPLFSNLGTSFSWVIRGLRQSSWYLGVAISGQLNEQIDRLVLMKFWGATAVGGMALMQNFVNAQQALVQAGLISIYLPKLLRAVNQNAFSNEKQMMKEFIAKVAISSALMILLIFVCFPYIVEFTAKTEFIELSGRFAWICAGSFFTTLSLVLHIYIYANHKDVDLFKIDVSIMACSCVLSLVLVPTWGLGGAVMSYCTASMIALILKVILYVNVSGKRWKSA